MPDFRIPLPCVECHQKGEIEHQVEVDHFHLSICPNCFGNGFKTYTENYDVIEDAKLDYPEALGIEGERGG